MAVLLAELAEAVVARLPDLAAAVVAQLLDLVDLVLKPPFLPHLALKARLPFLAHLALKARVPFLAHLVVEAQVADLVAVAAVPLQRLLSRQSFSAAMARNTP